MGCKGEFTVTDELDSGSSADPTPVTYEIGYSSISNGVWICSKCEGDINSSNIAFNQSTLLRIFEELQRRGGLG